MIVGSVLSVENTQYLNMRKMNNKSKERTRIMNEYEIEEHELKTIINECIESCNNQDLRTILDCLNEIGFDIKRPTEPIRS